MFLLEDDCVEPIVAFDPALLRDSAFKRFTSRLRLLLLPPALTRTSERALSVETFTMLKLAFADFAECAESEIDDTDPDRACSGALPLSFVLDTVDLAVSGTAGRSSLGGDVTKEY